MLPVVQLHVVSASQGQVLGESKHVHCHRQQQHVDKGVRVASERSRSALVREDHEVKSLCMFPLSSVKGRRLKRGNTREVSRVQTGDRQASTWCTHTQLSVVLNYNSKILGIMLIL